MKITTIVFEIETKDEEYTHNNLSNLVVEMEKALNIPVVNSYKTNWNEFPENVKKELFLPLTTPEEVKSPSLDIVFNEPPLLCSSGKAGPTVLVYGKRKEFCSCQISFKNVANRQVPHRIAFTAPLCSFCNSYKWTFPTYEDFEKAVA
jgi:hypothetical protein